MTGPEIDRVGAAAPALDGPGESERDDAAYRAAILDNPHDRAVLGRWMSLLEGQGRDVRAALRDLQASTDQLLGSVVTVLVERGTALEALDPVFQERIERFRAGESFAAIEAAWEAFSGLKPLPMQVRERLRPLLGSASLLAFLLRRPPIRRFSMNVGSSVTQARDVLGLNLRALKTAFNARFLGLSDNAWRAFLETEAVFPSEAARRTVIARDRLCLYQERAVAQRTLRFPHPVDRVEVEPIDAFVFSGRTVYTFPGSSAFLLIAGGGGSKALAGFLPAQNVLIDFGGAIGSAISDYALASLFGVMLRRLCAHGELYDAALSARGEGGPRKVCLGVGTAQNFAHHLWNYFSGFERLVRAGLAGHVDEVYFAGSQFYGPVSALFPEFSRARFIDYRRGMLDPHPFSSEHLLIQPGGYFIPETLRRRLTRAMQARPPVEPAPAEPRFPDKRPFPIVWIGLRLGDKAWSGQENETAAFIDRIAEAHPQALFLLDGFSYPVGADHSSAAWEPTITALRSVTRAIVAACRVPKCVVDMVGNTLRESVLWAREVDLYVTPPGTSQHKVGWLSAAPGIIYATRALEAVPRERRPGSWEAEGVSLPHHVFGEPAASGERRSINDRRARIDDVALDGDALAALALELITERERTLRR